jgi:hypothetical protein
MLPGVSWWAPYLAASGFQTWTNSCLEVAACESALNAAL